MGLFRIVKAIVQEKKHQKMVASMNAEELLGFDNEDLYEAISDRMLAEENKYDVEELLEIWNPEKQYFYIVESFSMEVCNGGLCQYFVNSSRYTAPYLEKALKEIGAEKYCTLFSSFVQDNDINVKDLESSDIEDLAEFEDQAKRYPFDDFDDAFVELQDEQTLEELLGAYVRAHIEKFE